MGEAVLRKDCDVIDLTTPAAGYASGEVIQLADGRAGVTLGLRALTSGEKAALKTTGQFTLLKTASVVILEGAPLYWDRSAGTATPLKALAGADFFIGVAVGDAAAADTTVTVDLNVQPNYTIDLLKDLSDTVLVGSAVVAQFPGYVKLNIAATNEAEKLDVMSQHSIPVAIPFIVEGRFAAYVIGTDNTVDFNIGVANGTHATDFASVTERLSLHLDEVLSLFAGSTDGTTTVAITTDTTVDVVDDTFIDFAIDFRDLADIKLYLNGVRVLAATVFKLNAATGPLKLIAHVEKTTGTASGEYRVAKLAARCTDVAA